VYSIYSVVLQNIWGVYFHISFAVIFWNGRKKSELKLVFDKEVKEFSVSGNCALLQAEKYAEMVAHIQGISEGGGEKCTNDYRTLKRYDVVVVDGTKKLI